MESVDIELRRFCIENIRNIFKPLRLDMSQDLANHPRNEPGLVEGG